MAPEFTISAGVRFRVIDDEAVVVRQREGDVVVLNEVAARVLTLVGEGLGVAELEARLIEEFDAPADVIRTDVESFLTELESMGVIERSSNSGPTP